MAEILSSKIVIMLSLVSYPLTALNTIYTVPLSKSSRDTVELKKSILKSIWLIRIGFVEVGLNEKVSIN